jgi:hypothetical protein
VPHWALIVPIQNTTGQMRLILHCFPALFLTLSNHASAVSLHCAPVPTQDQPSKRQPIQIPSAHPNFLLFSTHATTTSSSRLSSTTTSTPLLSSSTFPNHHYKLLAMARTKQTARKSSSSSCTFMVVGRMVVAAPRPSFVLLHILNIMTQPY